MRFDFVVLFGMCQCVDVVDVLGVSVVLNVSNVLIVLDIFVTGMCWFLSVLNHVAVLGVLLFWDALTIFTLLNFDCFESLNVFTILDVLNVGRRSECFGWFECFA